ncbi:MAG: family 10 glycosylhydrolase, partial [Fimbriimonadaceae bacterium]
EGIRAGVDQFDELYADALKWLQRGWCDYFTPQLYWPINQAPQSYRTLIEWWSTQNTRGIHLWPGNFTSRLWENAQGWSAQEVIDQIELTRRTRGATGNIHSACGRSCRTRKESPIGWRRGRMPARP